MTRETFRHDPQIQNQKCAAELKNFPLQYAIRYGPVQTRQSVIYKLQIRRVVMYKLILHDNEY
jgi:hypothetical protein